MRKLLPLWAITISISCVAGGPSLIWTHLIPSYCSSGCYALAEDSQENILVGAGPRTALTKLDPNGRVLWTWGRPLTDCTGHVWVKTIGLDASDNIYLGGEASPGAAIGAFHPGPGVGGVFFLKMNPAREIAFTRIATNMFWSQPFIDAGASQFFLAGSMQDNPIQYGEVNVAAVQNADVLILRVNAAGNPLWFKRGLGNGYENMNMLATDPSGNVFASITTALGSTFSIGGVLGSVPSAKTILLTKFDSAGNTGWIKSVGSVFDPNAEEPTSAPVCSSPGDNSVVWAGDFSGSLPLVSPPLAAVEKKDVFITKLTMAGDVLWARALGGPGNQFAGGLAVDSIGNIYLAGSFQNQITIGSETLTSRGGEDIFVAKLNADGVPLWTKQIGYSGRDTSPGVKLTRQGELLVFGTVQGGVLVDGHFTEGSYSSDGFVAKFGLDTKAPDWTRQPASAIASQGSTVVLECEATTQVEPLAYQWWFNGSALPGQTNASLTVTNFQPGQAGNYHVVASNPAGSIQSTQAAIIHTEAAALDLRLRPSMRIFGTLGQTYVIEYAAGTAPSAGWTVLTNLTLLASPQVWVDSDAEAGVKRIYRILLKAP